MQAWLLACPFGHVAGVVSVLCSGATVSETVFTGQGRAHERGAWCVCLGMSWVLHWFHVAKAGDSDFHDSFAFCD